MKPFECSWEDDVLAAVGTGRWPDRVDADLRAHVAHCAICRDIVTVAVAFGEPDRLRQGYGGPPKPRAKTEGSPLRTDAPRIPGSSVIWLRAQLRARNEAAKTAARPITVAQTLSFASIIGLFGVLLGASSAWLQTGVHWLSGMAQVLNPRGVSVPASLLAALTQHATLIASVGAVLLLMPVAVYFAMREPRT